MYKRQLQDTWAEAQARIGIDVTGGEVDEDTLAPEQMEKLATIRKVIEGDLIRLLFQVGRGLQPVSYTHLRAHETVLDLVCRLLLEKKKQ